MHSHSIFEKFLTKIVITSLAVALSACGGGGTSSTSGTSTVSPVSDAIIGKIFDGYLSGATVFWDCNLNGRIDNGEISSTSTTGGNYTINPAPKAGCRLTALIPATAIDEDTGTSVLMPYSMVALDSNNTIISPLTTLAVLNSSSSQNVAADEIKTKFSLTLSVDTDYVSKTTNDHTNSRKFGKITAQLLQANYSTTSGYTVNTAKTIVDGISQMQAAIKSASLLNTINRAIALPSSLWNKVTQFLYIDPALRVKINTFQRTPEQVTYLNKIILDPRITPYIGNGQVNWDRVDISTLDETNNKLATLGFTSLQTDILLNNYVTQTTILSSKYNPLLSNANTFITMDYKSTLALFDIAEATMKGAYGTVKMASIVPDISGVFANIAMTPGNLGKMINNLAKIKKYTDFLGASSKCGDGVSDLEVFTRSPISTNDYLKGLGGVSKIVGCLGDLLDTKGVSYVAGLFQGGTESVDDQFDGIMTLLDTLNIAIELTPPTSYTNFVSGFIDLSTAVFDSYKAGVVIAKQAASKTDVAQAEINALWDNQQKTLYKIYLVARVRALVSNSIIREDWVTTALLSVSPLTASVSKDITFTITGLNLTSGMGFAVDDCTPSSNELPGGTRTQRQFRCTFNGVPGEKNGVLKDKPGGTNTLIAFKVNVSNSPSSKWLSTITPPGYVVKQYIFSDLSLLPNGAFKTSGEYRINFDSIGCNLSQTLEVTGTRNGTSYDFSLKYVSPQTTCGNDAHTAAIGYSETYTGTLISGVLFVTPKSACSFSLTGKCYNFESFSPTQ